MSQELKSEPSSGLTGVQWLICAIAALGFAFDIYELLMMPLIARPALAELLKVDLNTDSGFQAVLSWNAYIMWGSALCGGTFGLLGGYLTDRFGRRRILMWSIMLYAFSALAAGFSTSATMLLILRCTTFIGVCVEFVAAVAWLAELFPDPKRREAVLGYTQAFSSVGGLLVTLAYWLLTENDKLLPAIFGNPDAEPHSLVWRYTLISGVIPALPLIIIRPFLPESPVWQQKRAAGVLKRPNIMALFQPAYFQTTIVTALLFACSYGAAFGAIQLMPQIVPGLKKEFGQLVPLRKKMDSLEKAATLGEELKELKDDGEALKLREKLVADVKAALAFPPDKAKELQESHDQLKKKLDELGPNSPEAKELQEKVAKAEGELRPLAAAKKAAELQASMETFVKEAASAEPGSEAAKEAQAKIVKLSDASLALATGSADKLKPKIEDLAKNQELLVKDVQLWQEIGGLVGRFALAFLAVRIVSRRGLLRIFQVPGLLLIPLVFVFPAAGKTPQALLDLLHVDNIMLLKIGIFVTGFLTVAQFSFWGNYLPRMYPVHLRGTGESFAANVGGRMVGTSANALTGLLLAPMFLAAFKDQALTRPASLAFAAAVTVLLVYGLGNIACFFLPEPSAKEEE